MDINLSSLIAETKTIKIPFPNMEGFIVEVTYLGKEKLRKIQEKSKTITFDNKTHQPKEGLDDEMFTKLYVKGALTGWTGLKFDYLKQLMLIDEDKLPKEGELSYSENNGFMLVSNSNSFDSWLSSVMSDISLFNKGS